MWKWYLKSKSLEYNYYPMLKFIFLITVIFSVACQDLTCDEDCRNCINGVCITCKNFYYLQNNTCFQCSEKCIACFSETNCTSCVYAYFSQNGKCTTCSNGCLQCLNKTNCINCANLFYRQNSTCLQCPKECASCNKTVCFGCVYGYYSSNYTCLPCNGSCSLCSYLVGCPNCGIRQYVLNNTCKHCPLFCQNCINNYTCNTCINNYFMQNQVCTWCGKCPNQTQCQATGFCAAFIASAVPEKSMGSLISIYVLAPIAFIVFLISCCLINIYKKSEEIPRLKQYPISETAQTISTRKDYVSNSRLGSQQAQLSINKRIVPIINVKGIIPDYKEQDPAEDNVESVTC